MSRPLGKYRKLTQSDVDRAIGMYAAGASLADVGAFFGVTRQAVYDLFIRRGVELRPQLRYGKDNHFYRGGVNSDQQVWNITEKAILYGQLTPKPCEVCGETGVMSDGRNKVQAHHDDYNKPLDVRWLCQVHHHEWHKNNKPIKRQIAPVVSEKGGEGNLVDVIVGGFPS